MIQIRQKKVPELLSCIAKLFTGRLTPSCDWSNDPQAWGRFGTIPKRHKAEGKGSDGDFSGSTCRIASSASRQRHKVISTSSGFDVRFVSHWIGVQQPLKSW
jgi:hypothetical protein